MNRNCLSLLLATVIVMSTFQGCRKDVSESQQSANLINDARSYFETATAIAQSTAGDLPTNTRLSPDWSTAFITSIHGAKTVVAVMHSDSIRFVGSTLDRNNLYSLNEISRLLFYKDENGQYKVERCTLFPDSNYVASAGNDFHGMIVVDDCITNHRRKFIIDKTGNEYELSANNSARVEMADVICVEVSGYNVSPEGGTYYWTETIGCSTVNTGSGGTGSVGGSTKGYGEVLHGGSSHSSTESILTPVKNFTVNSADKIISNASEYFKCFDNNPAEDHKYLVKLCVMQPKPGTREAWSFSSPGGSSATGNPVDVGHAYLVLTETTPTTVTVRNVGFYPKTGVTPFSPTSPGTLNNDEIRDYDVYVGIMTTSSQFTAIINYLVTNAKNDYNLNYNNCTSFILDALAAGYITMPRTIGSWTNGGGLNPGDLGEDLRIMPLSPNMTRSTVSGGRHLNYGTCY